MTNQDAVKLIDVGMSAYPVCRTYDQIWADLAIFTDAQRSLAWMPEPPHVPTHGDTNHGLGGVFGDESLKANWIRARYRWNREQKAISGLGGAK